MLIHKFDIRIKIIFGSELRVGVVPSPTHGIIIYGNLPYGTTHSNGDHQYFVCVPLQVGTFPFHTPGPAGDPSQVLLEPPGIDNINPELQLYIAVV